MFYCFFLLLGFRFGRKEDGAEVDVVLFFVLCVSIEEVVVPSPFGRAPTVVRNNFPNSSCSVLSFSVFSLLVVVVVVAVLLFEFRLFHLVQEFLLFVPCSIKSVSHADAGG